MILRAIYAKDPSAISYLSRCAEAAGETERILAVLGKPAEKQKVERMEVPCE